MQHTTNIDFASAMGERGIDCSIPPPIDGHWHWYLVDGKTRKKGAVKNVGTHILYNNHTDGLGVWSYKPDSVRKLSNSQWKELKMKAQKAEDARIEKQKKVADAAKKCWADSYLSTHAYLDKKGFTGMQWQCTKNRHGALVMLVPIFKEKEIVNLQIIYDNGDKRFISGGEVKGGYFVIGNGKNMLFCEGFATGYSAYLSLKDKLSCRVIVCFSDSNLVNVACKTPNPFVIADHDKLNKQTNTRAGHNVINKLGTRRYWMSEIEGNDFNDDWQKNKLKAGLSLIDRWHETNKPDMVKVRID